MRYTRAQIVDGTGWAQGIVFAAITPADFAHLRGALTSVWAAEHSDSNDYHLEALNIALGEALAILGVERVIPACAHGLCDTDAVEVIDGEPLCGAHLEYRHGK